MGTVMTYCKRIEELRCEIKTLEEAVVTLDKAFAQEADHLRRYDQAQCLDKLQARVAQEIRYEELMESSASLRYTEARLISGLAKAIGASLGSLVRPTKEHPLAIGARHAADEWRKSAPFKTVAVAVGPKGIPEDVRVGSLSRAARETGKPESEVRTALEGRGYRIMMPDEFLWSLGELKDKVLKGTASLPFIEARFSLKPLVPKLIHYQPEAKGSQG
jgi:hypothetical protein